QSDQFACVTERSAHDYGLVTMLFVVRVDVTDRNHARVGFLSIFSTWVLGLVPVQDTADEWGNQEYASFSAGTSLTETEQQCQVTVDAFPFQNFTSLDTFPCGSQLDQYTVL